MTANGARGRSDNWQPKGRSRAPLAVGGRGVSCVRIERRSEEAVQRRRRVEGRSGLDVGSCG